MHLIILTAKNDAERTAGKILRVKDDLESISEGIENFHAVYNEYPVSLEEKRFARFVRGISVRDPFDPEKNYRYRKGGRTWKLYSVGPNRTDDGGVNWRKGEIILLDIVIEREKK